MCNTRCATVGVPHSSHPLSLQKYALIYHTIQRNNKKIFCLCHNFQHFSGCEQLHLFAFFNQLTPQLIVNNDFHQHISTILLLLPFNDTSSFKSLHGHVHVTSGFQGVDKMGRTRKGIMLAGQQAGKKIQSSGSIDLLKQLTYNA
jgi:hypothetical protein